jgi:RimJ/RimL family protein N-acetyltransferase
VIELRPVLEADIETFYEFQADPEAAAMAVFGSRDRESHAANWHKIISDPKAVARTVLLDGKIAGNVLSWSHDGQPHVGYWIGREFWGRGAGTQALRLFVAEIETRPLYALVVVTNRGSQRVLEKSGFQRIEQRPSPDDGLEEYVYRLG